MANIFSLYGSIFIDNQKANESIDTTTKKAEGSGGKVKSAFGKIAKGAAAMGTAVVGGASAVAAGALKVVNSTADYTDQIDKLSERTGINREELQRWKHAADQSGVSVDSLKMATKKMSDVIADAQAGSKTAQDAISGLGLSLDDLSKASPEDAFNQVTAALADMEQGTNRNALGADVFGKAYTEMLPMLNAGSGGISALKKEADDLGLVMSESSVKAGVKFGDTLANVKDAAGGLKNQIGAALMPILQKMLDAIIQHMPQIQSAIQQITPIITMLFSQLLPPLMDLASQIFPVLMQLLLSLLPPISQIISSVLPVITQLLQMLLPPIIQIVDMVLPLLLSLIQPLLPLLQPLLELLQPFIDLMLQLLAPLIDLINMILPTIIELFTTLISSILPPLKAAFSGVAKVISGVFKTAFNAIKPIIDNVKKIFNGIIKFVTGVFSGDWDKAWEGIVDIFKGIINNIPAFFESVINGAIGLINGIIGGINGVTGAVGIPEIPKIPEVKLPRLRIGMEYVPYDDFPALLHKGEQVLTASEAKEYRKNKGGTQSTGTQVVNNYTFHIDKFVAQKKEDIKEFVDYLESEIATRTKKREAAQGNA